MTNINCWVPITALHVHADYLLIGSGNKLEVRSISNCQLNSLPLAIKWLTNHCLIHGIDAQQINKELIIAVFGNRFLSFLHLEIGFVNELPKLELIRDSINLGDWIMKVKLQGNKAFAILSSNSVVIINWKNNSLIHKVDCPIQCILYSAYIIVTDQFDNLLIVSGTVFKQALVWSTIDNHSQVSNTLEGHAGAVFAIEYNHDKKTLFTASDDRSIRVWSHDCCLTDCQNWSTGQFTLLHHMFGHVSRIWSLLSMNDYLISCGENEDLCIWSSDSGKLIHKSTREDASLWCLAGSKAEELIFIGSSDSSIRAWSLNDKVKGPDRHCFKFDSKFPKSMKYLISEENHQLICVTNDAMLLTFSFEPEPVIQLSINLGTDFESYCEICLEGCIVFCASKNGIIKTINLISKEETSFQAHSGKIFTCFQVNSVILLTSGPDGEIKLWKSGSLLHNYQLSSSKYRWVTSGLTINNYLIVGDRNGHIFVFYEDNKLPIQCLPNMHSANGVNDLKRRPNSDLFYSCGREGKIREYLWDGNSLQQLRLLPLRVDFDWIEKIIFSDNNLFLIGFLSTKFIIWQQSDQSVLWTIECGGGHRLWDFSFYDNQARFCCTKKTEIHFYAKQFNQLAKLPPIIKQGFHSNKINCCCLLDVCDDKALLATGGEDNNILISEFNVKTNSLQVKDYLKGHISSVRALTSFKKLDSSILIASGGGRSQLIVWSLEKRQDQLLISQLDCHYLWNVDGPKRKPWKDLKVINDPQARYLGIDIRLKEDLFLLSIVSSDSFLRLFSFNESKCLIECLCETQITDYCPLSVRRISDYYITGSTDGILQFWGTPKLDVKLPCSIPNNSLVSSFRNLNLSSNNTTFTELYQQSAHQSGINSIATRQIAEDKWLVISTGDDTTLTATLINLKNNQLTIDVQKKIHSVHHSQIPEVVILNSSLFVTCSVDQRVKLWAYSVTKNDISIELISSHLISVADISSAVSFHINSTHYLILAGEGLEALKLSE